MSAAWRSDVLQMPLAVSEGRRSAQGRRPEEGRPPHRRRSAVSLSAPLRRSQPPADDRLAQARADGGGHRGEVLHASLQHDAAGRASGCSPRSCRTRAGRSRRCGRTRRSSRTSSGRSSSIVLFGKVEILGIARAADHRSRVRDHPGSDDRGSGSGSGTGRHSSTPAASFPSTSAPAASRPTCSGGSCGRRSSSCRTTAVRSGARRHPDARELAVATRRAVRRRTFPTPDTPRRRAERFRDAGAAASRSSRTSSSFRPGSRCGGSRTRRCARRWSRTVDDRIRAGGARGAAVQADRRAARRRSPRSSPTCRSRGRCSACCRATSAPARRSSRCWRRSSRWRTAFRSRSWRRPRSSPSSTSARSSRRWLATPYRVALLSGTRHRGRRGATLLPAIERGDIHLVVGTHALVQEHVKFRALALAVIDEQHRFGVLQRGTLGGQGPASRRAGDDGDADSAHAGADRVRRHGSVGDPRPAAGAPAGADAGQARFAARRRLRAGARAGARAAGRST